MKLIDFTAFEPLDRIRRQMRAALPENFSFSRNNNTLTLADLEILGKQGIEIESLDELQVLPDGTLAYKDSRVLLYIRDVGIYSNRDPEESLPKFHLANCHTLRLMKSNNRFERYVVSIRTDGVFVLNFIRNSQRNNVERELNVCKNCLGHIQYQGYSNRNMRLSATIFNDFSIEEFFTLYPRSIIIDKPKYTSYDAPINDYAQGWNEVSRRYRAENDWSCEECNVDLSETAHRKYLHTHHIDGAKYNNSEENLKAVCILCHANEPMSSHIQNLPEFKEFLRIYPKLKKVV